MSTYRSQVTRRSVGKLGLVLAAIVFVSSPTPAARAAGNQVYREACAACHMENGEGLTGVYPALANNALVSGDPANFVRVLLEGRGGMPSFAAELTDRELAEVITFVRRNWGNNASTVTPRFIDQAAESQGREPLPTR